MNSCRRKTVPAFRPAPMRLAKRCALAIAAVLALLAPGLAQAEMTVLDRLAEGQPPLVIAQRALGGGAPENALAGIRHAIENGIDMVKIDVQLTRDGQHILMHDPTLNRTTDVEAVYPDGAPAGPSRTARGGRDYIRDYTAAEISRLRLTDGQDGAAHKVATLKEALELADGRIMLALGLKMYDTESLSALLKAHGEGNILFFDGYYGEPRLLEDIRATTGIKVLVGMRSSSDYLSNLEDLAQAMGPDLAMVTVYTRDLSPQIVARAHELGVALCISGLDAEDSALIYRDDLGPWQDALASGSAAAVLTAVPDAVAGLMGR